MSHQPSKRDEREEVESRFLEDFRAGKFINQTTGLQNPFEIEKWWNAEREKAVEESDASLFPWLNGNIGVSSTAILNYMIAGIVPRPFDCPHDASDRARCVVLLQCRPQWVERLKEIEALNIEGTRNGEKVWPWNEQIPLIREFFTS